MEERYEQVKELLGEKYQRDSDFLYSVVKKLDLNLNSKVLDIGTGRGFMAITLAVAGYEVTTGEPEGDNWGDWRTYADKAEVLNLIKFRAFVAEDLPFDDEKFDGVFSYGSFHHVQNKADSLREFIRVIKPNGLAVVFEFTQEGIDRIRQRHPNHPDPVDVIKYGEQIGAKPQIIRSDVINAYIFEKKE